MTASNASSDVLDCGRTIQELSEYLEAGRSPRDPEIEQCPECLNALESLSRVGDLSRDLFAADAASLPEPSAGWFGGILDQVACPGQPDVQLAPVAGRYRAGRKGAFEGLEIGPPGPGFRG